MLALIPRGALRSSPDGTRLDLSDETGALVESYSYDAYGKPAIRDGSGMHLPPKGRAVGQYTR